MTQKDNDLSWHSHVAVTTAVIAVLAAITSLRVGSLTSLIVLEKNNANTYQAKANKLWNHYLANQILGQSNQEQQQLKKQAEDLENQVDAATAKANYHFDKSSHLATAGTLFEVAIALSAMAVLIKKRSAWIFALGLVVVGGYFFLLGLLG